MDKNSGHRRKNGQLPVEADGLIPHTGPMIQIDRLVETGEKSGGVTETNFSEKENIFIDDRGDLDVCVYVELMAQTVAAVEGYKHRNDPGYTPEGMLAGIKNLEIKKRVVLGDTVITRITERAQLGAISLFRGEVTCDKKTVAEAEIKIFDTDTGEGFQKK